MRAEVYTEPGDKFLYHVNAAPKCGEDFCDSCGDCLHCYGDDWCPDGSHRWVVYGTDKFPAPEAQE